MKYRILALMVLAAGVVLASTAAPAGAAAGTAKPECLAHHPNYVEGVFEPQYTPGCTGHDEPEIDPLSNAPGSARNMTWTAKLPMDGLFKADAAGPTFWFGGTVHDPSSLFHQAFLEVQFYPDSVVSKCTPGGGFVVRPQANTYTVCSPVWSVVGNQEPAAFNAMLRRAGSDDPLIMHGGDTVTVHYYTTAARDGAHITVHDLTTGKQGTIILNSKKHGPLMPEFGVQKIGNTLGWGIVHDAPNAFVWEIGHTGNFTSPPGEFCLPGQAICQSYNAAAWEGTTPIQIESVHFGHAAAKHWAVVSDFGGRAEVLNPATSFCHGYGGPFCIYPWYTQNHDGSFSFGVDYPTTANDFGKVNQYQMNTHCDGPFGEDTTYCMTKIR